MVENEKIIKEDIKLPNDILSETDEIKLEDNNDEVKLEDKIKLEDNNQEIKVEEKEEIKVADTKFTAEQEKDFNKLLELGEKPEDAKAIILGEPAETKKIDFKGKSEYEVDKEVLANDGIDLEENFLVYPNPVKGSILNIRRLDNKPMPYTIVNVVGQVVKKGQTTNKVNVSNLETGNYFMKILTAEKVFTTRFIKN